MPHEPSKHLYCQMLSSLLVQSVEEPELKELLSRFMTSFELVFNADWEYTLDRLPEASFIDDGCTFLHPGMGTEEEEANNWANRGRLLQDYRKLKDTMINCGIYEELNGLGEKLNE